MIFIPDSVISGTGVVISVAFKPVKMFIFLLLVVTNFIMKAFINGRKLFGTPFYPVPGTEVVCP